MKTGDALELRKLLELLAAHAYAQRDIPVMDEFVLGAGDAPDGHQGEFAQPRVELGVVAQLERDRREAPQQIGRVGDRAMDMSGRGAAVALEFVEDLAFLSGQIFAANVRQSRHRSSPCIKNSTPLPFREGARG